MSDMRFFDKDKRVEFEAEITHWLGDEILKTKYMADRLDNISMMGLVYYLAKVPEKYQYTRYDHTLAVTHLTLQLCQKLSFSDTQIRLALLAALSHDIGHGPFSHSSESYLRWNAGNFQSHQKGDHPKKIEAMLRACMGSLPGDLKTTFPDLRLLAESVYLITQGKSILEWGSNVPSSVDIIPKIFDSPLSPDVLDGDNRAFLSLRHISHLELKPSNPESMVGAISSYGEMLVVDKHGKSMIENFSQLQRNLYSWVISSKSLETGEAMLARAIELAYQERSTKIGYTNLTDKKVIKQFSRNLKSAALWDDLRNSRLFIALSSKDVDLFNQVCDAFPLTKKTGEDFKVTKKNLENWLAEYLNLDADFVIAQVLQQLDWNPSYLRFKPKSMSGSTFVTKWQVSWEESYGMPNIADRRLEVYIPR